MECAQEQTTIRVFPAFSRQTRFPARFPGVRGSAENVQVSGAAHTHIASNVHASVERILCMHHMPGHVITSRRGAVRNWYFALHGTGSIKGSISACPVHSFPESTNTAATVPIVTTCLLSALEAKPVGWLSRELAHSCRVVPRHGSGVPTTIVNTSLHFPS